METDSDQVTVATSAPRERLDTYLRSHYPHLSRGVIQRLIAEHAIQVNGQPTKSTHHPRAGDVIMIHWPEPKPSQAQPEAIELDILFEDEDLIVINKAPDIVVHPSSGHREHTLVNALLHHCAGQLSGVGGVERPGIVHRLDKETSGCLVIAKNDRTHLALAKQFASRQVEKSYQALVCGAIQQDEGEIRVAIGRHPNHRKRMAVTERQGRDARTSFRVTQRLGRVTLAQVELHTGRTHQIRVHLLHIGHPLVGDPLYGKRYNNRLKEETGFEPVRQMLHADTLTFIHPRTNEPLTLTARLPEDFCAAIRSFRSVISDEPA